MKTTTLLVLDGSVVDFLTSYHTRKCIALEGNKVNQLSVQATTSNGEFAFYFIHQGNEIIASKSLFTLVKHYQDRYKSE